MRVIGIDIHPGKKSMIYDGKEFSEKGFNQLKDYLAAIREKNERTLICCDAPLTGQRAEEKMSEFKYETFKYKIKNNKRYTTPSNSLTKRDIEYFFTNGSEYNVREIPGINVGNYSNLSHWTVTNALFGLPIMGTYCQKELPFKNIHSNSEIIERQNLYITEVHPALAIWIWSKRKKIPKKSKIYGYKKGKEGLKKIKELLLDIDVIKAQDMFSKISNDDQLDAYISWKLGDLWINEDLKMKVDTVGTSASGTFLLPYPGKIQKSFEEFINSRITIHEV